MRKVPAVSVCLSTFNRAGQLDRLLSVLADQQVAGGFEVVVVDNGSSDDTPLVLHRHAAAGRLALTPLRLDVNRGPTPARQAAWRAARAPLVVFTDDDCVPAPGWLEAHAALAGPLVVAVGRTDPDPTATSVEGPFSRTVRVADTRFFQTCNISYPRELLERVGGFDERFQHVGGEDTDLGLRALELGAVATFADRALVHHDVSPSSLRGAVRTASRWVDLPLVVKCHPSTRESLMYHRWWWKRSHPPTVLAALSLVLSLRWPWALFGVAPWVRFRTQVWPVPAGPRNWVWVLPGQLVVDATEVFALARGSVRHRTLLL
jgi:glycosyltransferase involved in cell wall biosynthesis